MAGDSPSYLERRRQAGTYRTAAIRPQRPRASARFRASIANSVAPENRANYYTDADIDRESARTQLFNTRGMQDAVTEGVRGRELSDEDMTAYHQRSRAIGDYALRGEATSREAAGGIRALGGTLGRARIQEQPRAPILEPKSPGAPPPPQQQIDYNAPVDLSRFSGGGRFGPVMGAPVGPDGRTFAQIQGTEYLSDAERAWYHQQQGTQVPGANAGPAGRTLEQVRGTPYLSDEERAWYLSQQPATPPRAAIMAPPPASSGRWTDWGEGVLNEGRPFGALGRFPYQGQSNFPAAVEQWRDLVGRYFKPEDVNKALYVIQHESGGRNIRQVGGPAVGLFQIEGGDRHPGRPAPDVLLDPETNVRYAASMVYR